jgi:asparagine synthase (glutamine-hydrolysing)
MCGITGYWVRRGDPAAWRKDADASVESLRSRGPDDSGLWAPPGGRIALGHTRLSILDLSPLGRQPMRSSDGSLTMVFNGEVYNFAAIRAELETLGHHFRSSGDSEVILAAFQQWGVAALERFIGMFAIALWDEKSRRLLLLRDRMGVKPVYYAWDGAAFWFGSELKALRAFEAWRPRIDNDALGEYLQYGYISAPRSIYQGVRKLLPGHWLELGESGEPVTRAYWTPAPVLAPFEENEDELERRLEPLLIDAFRHRMVSDVPVGMFLSGGVDSSLVTAILQRHGGGELRTFTIGFDDAVFDESRWAKRVAGHLGTHHTEYIATGADMRGVLAHWAELFDEPFGDSSGVPTYLVSRMAREHVKVALSADGGDELFNGYDHYGVCIGRERSLTRWPMGARRVLSTSLQALCRSGLAGRLPLPAGLRHAARRGVIERLEKLAVILPGVDRAQLYDLAMSSWTPWEIPPLLGGPAATREAVTLPGASFADEMARSDLRHYLPDDILVKLDRTGMANGLEGREPFLDHRLVEFALRVPLALRRGPLGTKHLLRKILYRYVPRELIERPKQGFAVPLASWLRRELAPLVHDHLSPRRIREAGIFDPALVAGAVSNFFDGGPGNDRLDSQKLWYLVAFEMWREKWMRAPQRPMQKACHARAVHHQ